MVMMMMMIMMMMTLKDVIIITAVKMIWERYAESGGGDNDVDADDDNNQTMKNWMSDGGRDISMPCDLPRTMVRWPRDSDLGRTPHKPGLEHRGGLVDVNGCCSPRGLWAGDAPCRLRRPKRWRWRAVLCPPGACFMILLLFFFLLICFFQRVSVSLLHMFVLLLFFFRGECINIFFPPKNDPAGRNFCFVGYSWFAPPPKCPSPEINDTRELCDSDYDKISRHRFPHVRYYLQKDQIRSWWRHHSPGPGHLLV